MEIQHLQITGKRELTFLGDEIGFATDKNNPQEDGEWTKLRLFAKYDKTSREFDCYVLGTAKLTSWGLDHERDTLRAHKFKTIKDALRFVEHEFPHLSDVLARDVDERGTSVAQR